MKLSRVSFVIIKLKADVGFRGFSDQELFAMVNSLVAKLKIRIDEISINKKITKLFRYFFMYPSLSRACSAS